MGRHPVATCSNNLRQIAWACMTYADDNDDQYPDKLERLYPDYVDNAKVFSCPESPSSWQDFESGNVTAVSSSYTLVPGLTASMPGGVIVAYETAQNHPGRRIVTYLDCHAERLREIPFQKELARQLKALSTGHKPGTPSLPLGRYFEAAGTSATRELDNAD